MILGIFQSFFFAALLFFAIPAEADEKKLPTPYQDCLDKNSDNMSWDACGHAELKRQNDLMAKAYRKVFEALKEYQDCVYCQPNSAIQSLNTEQYNWKKYYNTACMYYRTGNFGREGDVLSYPICKVFIIIERTKYLNEFGDGLSERLHH